MSAQLRTGFWSLVGPTNAGKSTLLNKLLGEKISIVSPKPQTTLRVVRGILNGEDYQFVLSDTPGLHDRQELMMKQLGSVIEKEAKSSDRLLWIFDASKDNFFETYERWKSTADKWKHKQLVCLLNKVDKIEKTLLLPMIDRLAKDNLFTEIIPVSAKDGLNLDRLVQVLKKSAPDEQAYYDRSQKTDRSLDFQIAELVREKIYQTTSQEIPYSIFIDVEKRETPDQTRSVPLIHVSIHVDSNSKKPILIGKGGRKLKEIGSRARADVEKLLGYQVCLKLFVNVHNNWKNNPNVVNEYLELQ